MAGDNTSGSDYADHEKTYLGFLLGVKISSAVTIVTLLLLYFTLV